MRFLPLLLTIFIDSLGFGLAFPVFSPLIMEPASGMLPVEASLALRGTVFGLLISAFCIGQFFGGPILGALSDRKGRKKVLLLSLWAAFASYILAAASIHFHSIAGLFFSRILGGVAAGNFAVAQSMIADGSTPENKGKNFGLLGMSWGTGFIIGPFIGGKLSDPQFTGFASWTLPFLFAALLCLINIAAITFKLKESLTAVNPVKIDLLGGFGHIRKAFTLPKLRGLFFVMFLFSFGWGFFTEFSGIFLIRRFQFTQGSIGNFYAVVGILVALSQGVLIRPFLKRFKTQQLLLGGLIALGLCLPALLLAQQGFQIYYVMPFLVLSESLIYPTASNLVSDLSGKEEQGEMLGIHNSVQWAAIGIAPLFSGSFVALYPHLPITVSSACMFLAAAACLWQFKVKKSLPSLSGK